jgi:hypothetical protein
MDSQRPIAVIEIQVGGEVGASRGQIYRWVAPPGMHIMADTTSYFSWAPIGRRLRFYASREDALPAYTIGLGGPGIPGYYRVSVIFRVNPPTGTIYPNGIVCDLSGKHHGFDGFNIAHVNKTALTREPGMVI